MEITVLELKSWLTTKPMTHYLSSEESTFYCGLREDEALLLGIIRNEDTEQFVKLSDFQKVEEYTISQKHLKTVKDTNFSQIR